MAVLNASREIWRPDKAFPALPDEAPLVMPTQSLRRWAERGRAPNSSPPGMAWRRLFVIGAAAAMTIEAAHEMYRALGMGILPVPEALVLALYVALFGWIAFAFTSALGGCLSMLSGGSLGDIALDRPPPPLSGRTALLMPTYNESPARVIAGLQAIYESLKTDGIDRHFDIFILSDTTDPDIWVAEEAGFLALRDRTGAPGQIFYRRRPKNTARKAGNIADWVQRFGGAYPQMLVLDADSIMTGEAIHRLSAAMEHHDDVGLIQSLPTIVNGTTPFARAQQFAARLYGPLIARGLSWWQGSEGNYWGHNAVIRTRAFAEAAGLPELKGRKPFGGHIMSHDFVEAALLRRAGWAVHLIPEMAGSYEESPPSLRDLAARDRRWCQGNLQHAAVLAGRGLHWVSRLNLLTGIGAYITSPLWLMFLISGILLSLHSRFVRPHYFSGGPALFPDWPQVDPVRAESVFIGTMLVLLAPKVLAYMVLLFQRATRRGFGGGFRALLSVVVETAVTGLLAPTAMLSQSVAVADILLARDSGWKTQRRDEVNTSLGELLRVYAGHTVFGLAFAAVAYLISPFLFLWMLPVILGLTLSIPMAFLTARPGVGQALYKLGILLTPEEQNPPPILKRARYLFRSLRETKLPPAVQQLMADRRLLDLHLSMLPGMPQRKDLLDADFVIGMARLEAAESASEIEETLSKAELLAILGNHRGVCRLLMALQCRPRDEGPVR
jgi:membrane glycosyltransferase